MDELVLRGMAKWPNVPSVYGWLRLDRRGHWHIKEDRVTHSGIVAFIGRNYEHDAEGRWFFQNGPQRVFVALDYAPFVWRIGSAHGAPLEIESHTGKPVSRVDGAWLDEQGVALLRSEHGVGTVHDGDLERLVPAFSDMNGSPLAEDVCEESVDLLQQGRDAPLWLRFREANVKVEPIRAAAVPARFGFVAQPFAPAGAEACT